MSKLNARRRGYLVRIEQPDRHTIGWQARLPIPGEPRLYRSRFYADKLYGGNRKAKRLASQWLKEPTP